MDFKWVKEEAVFLDIQCDNDCENCKVIVCAYCNDTITEHDDAYYYSEELNINICEGCKESFELAYKKSHKPKGVW